MKKIVYTLAPLAVIALAACGPTREQQAADAEAKAEAEAAAAPIDMPPAITSSSTYRCADSTVLYVDFYAENKGALIRAGEKTATPLRVSAPAPVEGEEATVVGKFASDDGETTLSGSGANISVKLPGKDEQACKS